MTVDETKVVLGTLKAAYPKTFAELKKADAQNMIGLWHEMLSDFRVEDVISAVKHFILSDEKGFPPSIGMIAQRINRMTSMPSKSPAEAWIEVKRALSNCLWNNSAFEEIEDPTSKRIVGSVGQMREWSMMEVSTLDSVIGSHFQRNYRELSEREKERAELLGISDGSRSAISGYIR